MNVFLISGSPRAGSNSLKVAKYLAALFENEGHTTTGIADLHHSDMPRVGRGSLNPEALTPFQTSLVDGWSKADIVIVLAPEYNWTTSGELLDLLHVSAGPAFSGALFGNKVFGIVGVSSGRGGRMPAVEVSTVVNKLVSFTNNISVVSPKILESHETAANLDADGVFVGTAAIYDKTARDFVAYTTNIATRWQCEVPA